MTAQAEPTADEVAAAIVATASAARACRDGLRDQPRVQRFYRFILETFAATGQSPGVGALAAVAGKLELSPEAAMAALTERDLVVAGCGQEPAIRAAYPFSAVPTQHQVTLDSGLVICAVCALDAIGIPLMLHRDAAIASAEPDTGYQVRVTIRGKNVTWEPETAVLFIAPVQGDGPAADCACRDMNFFTTRQAAADWASRQHRTTGWILDHDQALARAGMVFGRLLDDLPALD